MKSSILVRNNVKLLGHGRQPLLFAHGFGCDQNMWRFVTPAFENDYKLVLFDYVGWGKSDLQAYNSERYSNLNGYVDDVLEICEALDLQEVIFVGHSVSSMVGILAANREPHRFASLILVGPSPCYINQPGYVGGFERRDIAELLETMDKNYLGWANFLAPVVMKNPDKPELTQELAQSFCSTDPVIARRFAEVTFFSDNRRDLGKSKIPALILQCSEDLIAPDTVGVYLQGHMHGSVLHRLAATGHCPHMSAPDETIAAMKSFLAREGQPVAATA